VGKVTFFARPGFGGIHEAADINLTQVTPVLEELGIPVPSAHQTDTQLFFGLGGGFDLNVSRRIGLRFATDWVNTHLFNNLLTNRQNYVRFAVGRLFAGAKEVAKRPLRLIRTNQFQTRFGRSLV